MSNRCSLKPLCTYRLHNHWTSEWYSTYWHSISLINAWSLLSACYCALRIFPFNGSRFYCGGFGDKKLTAVSPCWIRCFGAFTVQENHKFVSYIHYTLRNLCNVSFWQALLEFTVWKQNNIVYSKIVIKNTENVFYGYYWSHYLWILRKNNSSNTGVCEKLYCRCWTISI